MDKKKIIERLGTVKKRSLLLSSLLNKDRNLFKKAFRRIERWDLFIGRRVVQRNHSHQFPLGFQPYET